MRRLIVAKALKSIPEVMQELEWKTSCGCAKCRPALNYYLLADWPGEYVDDKQSRFINERVHANIQKDGTYSVVPRMWGGMTTAGELRAIADVVDKFNIPDVKVTGGQRIDLLGVKKEDLPAVWADLNAEATDPIERLRLAHTVYNRFDKAEFVKRGPWPVVRDGREVAMVEDYQHIHSEPAEHTFFAES